MVQRMDVVDAIAGQDGAFERKVGEPGGHGAGDGV